MLALALSESNLKIRLERKIYNQAKCSHKYKD